MKIWIIVGLAILLMALALFAFNEVFQTESVISNATMVQSYSKLF